MFGPHAVYRLHAIAHGRSIACWNTKGYYFFLIETTVSSSEFNATVEDCHSFHVPASRASRGRRDPGLVLARLQATNANHADLTFCFNFTRSHFSLLLPQLTICFAL